MARNLHRLITTGRPGWATVTALKMFARIREYVPDAELHLYMDGPQLPPKSEDPQIVHQHRQIAADYARLSKQGGVTVFLGQAPPEAFEDAVLWLYPTHMGEIYVPAAEDAQLHGCVPIYNPIGALIRDVKQGIRLQGTPCIDRLVFMRYIYEAVRFMCHPELQELMRGPMIEKATAFFANPISQPLPWRKVHQIVQQADQIKGWMTESELAWLTQTAASVQSVVEIGSFRGRSTFAMLSACPGTVTAVDHWKGGGWNEPEWLHREHTENDLHAAFLKNVGHFKNLRVIKRPSVDAALAVRGPAEMTFIDGDHGYEACRADIRAWLPKTTRIICGHDYDWESVRRACKDELGPVERGPDAIWFKMLEAGAMSNAAD